MDISNFKIENSQIEEDLLQHLEQDYYSIDAYEELLEEQYSNQEESIENDEQEQ